MTPGRVGRSGHGPRRNGASHDVMSDQARALRFACRHGQAVQIRLKVHSFVLSRATHSLDG